jgi:hypothetical protein
MIELNPRATQLGHLPLAQTGTLAAALLARSSGESLAATAAPRILPELVAFFPQAWISGVNSPRLRSAYQDIPWDQPKLMAHLLRRLGDGCGTLTRVIDRLTGRREARFLAEFHQQTNGLDQTSGLPCQSVVVSARSAAEHTVKQRSSMPMNAP